MLVNGADSLPIYSVHMSDLGVYLLGCLCQPFFLGLSIEKFIPAHPLIDSTLQGQTTFQRLACWVLLHNPQPEVPFQVDNDNGEIKLVLGYP